jgi:hypothetical protein
MDSAPQSRGTIKDVHINSLNKAGVDRRLEHKQSLQQAATRLSPGRMLRTAGPRAHQLANSGAAATTMPFSFAPQNSIKPYQLATVRESPAPSMGPLSHLRTFFSTRAPTRH